MESRTLLMWTLCIVRRASGFSTGIPIDARAACASMFPVGHGAEPQTSSSPFVIRVSHTTYIQHRTLTVTLDSRCNHMFKGFLIQARRADPELAQNELIGTFMPVPFTRSVCGPAGSSGLTQDSNMTKRSLEFTWTAPHGLNDHIVFRATFVEDFHHFWVNVTSPIVMGNQNVRFPYQTTWNTRTYYPCSIPEAKFHLDHRCGADMGCFHDCDAMEDCSVQVSWRDLGPQSTEIEFTIKVIILGNGDKWAAIGFSEDTQMGWDSVVECVEVGTGIFVFPSINLHHSNMRLQRFTNRPLEGLTPIAGSDRDGVFQCTFRRNKTIGNDAQYFDLDSDYYLLVATGRATPDGEKIRHITRPWVSRVKLDLQKTDSVHVHTIPKTRPPPQRNNPLPQPQPPTHPQTQPHHQLHPHPQAHPQTHTLAHTQTHPQAHPQAHPHAHPQVHSQHRSFHPHPQTISHAGFF